MSDEKDHRLPLERQRERMGWSIERLSHATGIPVEDIRAFETGDEEPMGSQLKLLARAFGCSADCLVGIADE